MTTPTPGIAPAPRAGGGAPQDAQAGTGRAAAVLTWTIGVLTTGLAGFLGLHWLGRWAKPGFNDFSPFYAAGTITARGHLARVYDNPALYRVEATLAGGHTHHLQFPYTPDVASFFGVMARLPFHVAYDLWTVVNLLAYVLAGALVIRRVQGLPFRLLAALLLAGCLPIVISTVQGENAGLLALGVTLMLVSIEASQSGGWMPTSGIALGVLLVSVKPQLLLVPLVLTLARRHRTEILAAGVGLFIAVTTGMVTGGIKGYVQFGHLLLTAHKWEGKSWGPSTNYSLVAQLHALLGNGLAANGLTVAGYAGALFVYVKFIPKDRVPWLATVTLGVLLADHLLFHDLAILYPAVILTMLGAVTFKAATREESLSRPPCLTLPALGLLLSPWLDPLIYRFSSIHVVVLACLTAFLMELVATAGVQGQTSTISGYRARIQGGLWRLFAPLRWGSVSGSETRSTS